ncbi:MAG: hypothetical protein Roseis2KO_55380 [Roseivirga sp.]
MNHDQDTYELIERYLQHDLQGDELTRFEQALQQDESLVAEVNLQRSVQQLLVEEDVQALDKQLTDLRKDYGAETPKLLPFRKIWFAAAAVLMLSIAYIGFFMQADPLSGEEAFTTYFEPYPADNAVRSDDDSLKLSQMYQGLEAYERADYGEAMTLLQPLLKESIRARFYYGVSQLAIGETERAIATLAEMSNEDSIYEDPAAWYSALGLLKLGEREQAVNLLERIVEVARGKYRNLAIELLKKLK